MSVAVRHARQDRFVIANEDLDTPLASPRSSGSDDRIQASLPQRQRTSESSDWSIPAPLCIGSKGAYGRVSTDELERIRSRLDSLFELESKAEGEEVTIWARLHAHRVHGRHLVFLVLRLQTRTIQGVVNDDGADGGLVHFAKQLPLESIILVSGQVQRPAVNIKGTSIHGVEIRVRRLHVISERRGPLAFSVHEAEYRPLAYEQQDEDVGQTSSGESEDSSEGCGNALHTGRAGVRERPAQLPVLNQRLRLNNRILDLRTPTSLAIFRVQAAVGRLWRAYLDAHGFIEIHTPKLQAGASESGASVFTLDYFGRRACLAQSPQLFKQAAIAADFARCYEVGAVYRAEDSNTPRHLTEYTGLDLEMALITGHYHEMMHVVDAALKSIFVGLRNELAEDLDVVRSRFPVPELVWLEKTPVIDFSDAVALLREDGWKDDEGRIPSDDEDLSTRAEVRLGQLVKQRHGGTDYFILDRFPRSVRPFYTMPDREEPKKTRSFDIFLRGQEICTGGQRIHELAELEASLRAKNLNRRPLREYLEAFRLGAPPHAGAGIGLERFVMLYLGLPDIRLGSMFHRDPRSLQLPRPRSQELLHPEASTLPPSGKISAASAPSANTTPSSDDAGATEREPVRPLQPLSHLIANYGDSANTAWLDRAYTVWRDVETGAAVGYIRSGRYATVIGDPLCHPSQIVSTIRSFLQHLKRDIRLKPVWTMISGSVEDVLVAQLGWRSLSCLQEDRIPAGRHKASRIDPDLGRKVRHARREGVHISEYLYGQGLPPEVLAELTERVDEWRRNRAGKRQAHMSEVQPLQDQEHRSVLLARDRSGRICAAVVLARISKGWQLKWSLAFSGAPSGALEMTIVQAIESVEGYDVSFGVSARHDIVAGEALGNGLAFKAIAAAYRRVASRWNLVAKGQFREKFGVVAEKLYIAFPGHGLSPRAIKAVAEVFLE